MVENLRILLEHEGLSPDIAFWIRNVIVIVSIVLLCIISNFIARKIILNILKKIADKTTTDWDDILFERHVFDRLSYIAPALVIYFTISLALTDKTFDFVVALVQTLTKAYIVLVILLVIESLLSALNDIYNTYEVSKTKPIKGYIQVIKIIFFLLGSIIIISILMNKSPVTLLAGIGALGAVLMLVFKDTLMNLVASIQISTNDMIRIGDWITMTKYGADGNVSEMNLSTIKIINGDKTITSIPTYAFVNDAFQNWRGMEESGARRIKRFINIDVNSIKFCTDDTLGKFKKINILKDYIVDKTEEIKKYNFENNFEGSNIVNGRRLTNIGVFRKYVELYLKNNQNIHQDMILLVRQLQPTENGLPLEIYVFSKIQSIAEYEAIQSDIFDHIFAAITEFELAIFQNPSGGDFTKLK